jgi:hypothetical protein
MCPLFLLLQGLANMLWSYAKLPVAPPAVVFALVHKITDQLVMQSQRPDGASTFDAQVRLGADKVVDALPVAAVALPLEQLRCSVTRASTRRQACASNGTHHRFEVTMVAMP